MDAFAAGGRHGRLQTNQKARDTSAEKTGNVGRQALLECHAARGAKVSFSAFKARMHVVFTEKKHATISLEARMHVVFTERRSTRACASSSKRNARLGKQPRQACKGDSLHKRGGGP